MADRQGGSRSLKALVCNERGFPLVELYMVMAIIVIIILIAVPGFLRVRNQKQAAPENCMNRIEAAAAALKLAPGAESAASIVDAAPGADPDDLTCPVVDKPYALSVHDGTWRICCPDPGNHIGLHPEGSCLTPAGWRVGVVGPVPPEGSMVHASSWYAPADYHVTLSGQAVTVDEDTNALKAVFVPIGGAVLIFLVIRLTQWIEDRKEKFSLSGVFGILNPMLAFAGGVCILYGLMALMGFVALSKETRITPEGFSHQQYRLLGGTSVKRVDAIAVTPTAGNINVVYRNDEGKLRAVAVRVGDRELARKVSAYVMGRIWPPVPPQAAVDAALPLAGGVQNSPGGQ